MRRKALSLSLSPNYKLHCSHVFDIGPTPFFPIARKKGFYLQRRGEVFFFILNRLQLFFLCNISPMLFWTLQCPGGPQVPTSVPSDVCNTEMLQEMAVPAQEHVRIALFDVTNMQLCSHYIKQIWMPFWFTLIESNKMQELQFSLIYSIKHKSLDHFNAS